MSIENLLSNIIDDKDTAKEVFADIMNEKVLGRLQEVRDEIGYAMFNSGEFVNEDWSEDDVYISLGKFANIVEDIATLNDQWNELSDEDKTEIVDDEDDWYWDDDQEDVVNESKRHLIRYNEQYHALMEEYKTFIMEDLKAKINTFNFSNLNEALVPFATKLLNRGVEIVYDSIAELPDEKRHIVAENTTAMFRKIFPLDLQIETNG